MRKFITKKKTKNDVKSGKGTKDDAGKVDLTLLDPLWLIEVARVMNIGQLKYKRGNWQLKLEPRRILAALLRHVMAIQQGEEFDPESKFRHSAHVACNSMFLNYYERHGNPVILEHKVEKIKLKKTPKWSKLDDEVFERYYKSLKKKTMSKKEFSKEFDRQVKREYIKQVKKNLSTKVKYKKRKKA